MPNLSKQKATKMLKDKSVRGKPLTTRQRKFFGFISGGGKPKLERDIKGMKGMDRRTRD